jgi:dihydropteroate synthase
VSGLTADPAVAELVARTGAGLIVMASPRGARDSPRGSLGSAADSPLSVAAALLSESLELARVAGIAEETIAVDPGIGFFRQRGRPWFEWDCQILARLGALQSLGRPICIGVSRKSFIGALLGQDDPADRLAGSLGATAVAVVNGAHLIRTHDAAETSQAVRVAQAIAECQE